MATKKALTDIEDVGADWQPPEWSNPEFSPLPAQVVALNAPPGEGIVPTPDFREFLDVRRKQIQEALLEQMGGVAA